jgi:hypothetical protein
MNEPADKKAYETSGGYTSNASAAAIAFLWSNWEVLYNLNPGRIEVKRLSDTSWEGKGFMGFGEWHLSKRLVGVDSGIFEFLAFGRFLGTRLKGKVSMQYRRVNKEETAYFGKGLTTIPTLLLPLRWLFHISGTKATAYINKTGGETAQRITKNPSLVKDKAGTEKYKTYLEFIEEEEAIYRGATGDFQHFSTEHRGEVSRGISNEIELLKRKLEQLEQKIESLGLEANINDYHLSLHVFNQDPKMALVKNRVIVEQIAKILFERELRKPSGTRMLGDLITQIVKDSDHVPSNIIALMRVVEFLGNVGSHAEKASAARSFVDSNEYSVSFNATIRVTEWYFIEYLPHHGM